MMSVEIKGGMEGGRIFVEVISPIVVPLFEIKKKQKKEKYRIVLYAGSLKIIKTTA